MEALQVLGTILAAAGVALVVWAVCGGFFLPLGGKSGELTLVLHLAGNSPTLAQTVRGLVWLRQIFHATPELILVDDGMDEETRQVAERLTQTYEIISIRNNTDG